MAVSRRYFFYGSLLAGAVPLAGYGSSPSLKQLGYRSPNEKLNIASIGAGGRAASDITGCSSENIVALADPDDKRAELTYKKYEKAAKYKDFRKMLDKEAANIDAVIVATPDHMHATAAIWCMERGKSVYVEKPLTRTIAEARLLTEAAQKYKVATQMGNQGYSNDGARIAAEVIWSGEIGQVKEVHAWTNRPIWPQGVAEAPAPSAAPSTLDWDLWLGIAKDRPYTSGGEAYANKQFGFYAPFNWRGFFDFGCGALGDMACHILGAPNMALKLGAPTSVECIQKEGASPIMFPKKTVTRFDFPARGSMPALKLFWHDACEDAAYRPPDLGASEPYIAGEGSFGAIRAAAAAGIVQPPPAPGSTSVQANGAVFIGEKGCLTTDTYAANCRVLPEARMKDLKQPAEWLTRSPGHHRDWLRAAKGGEPSCSNFSVAGPLTEWILLGVVAARVEGKLEWDREKMRFTNSPEANRYVRPEVRKGWNLKV